MNAKKTMSSKPEESTSTEDNAVRTRLLVRGVISSFASRGLAALVPLAMIPLMLTALGTTVYGAWMAIVSITSMLVWADLGLGNGLMTRLSRHLAHDDHRFARRDILATYAIVSLVAFLLCLSVLRRRSLCHGPDS